MVWVQQLVNGLILGVMLALMSTGLSLVFGLMRTANFAYGALYMLGGYCAYWAVHLLGLSFVWSLIVAFIAMFALGALICRYGFEVFRGNEDATLVFGLSLALIIHGLAVIAWGSQPRFMDAPEIATLRLGPIIIPGQRLFAFIVSICLLAILFALIKYSRWGRVTRAVADDPVRAGLLGVNVSIYTSAVIGLGTGLSAVACVLLIPVYGLSPTVDDNALFTAFTVVILGGLGSITGCLLGGIIIGVITTFALTLTNTLVAPAFPLIVLLLVLMFRPSGLFGKQNRIA